MARKTKQAAPKRQVFRDDQKIKVVGEHNRREGSRFFKSYEAMRKIPSVAAFRKRYRGEAQMFMRCATRDRYAKIS